MTKNDVWKRSSRERRHFVGGSDARIVMGTDEEALIRLWREKRGEVEPQDLSLLFALSLLQPDARPSSVLFDEFDAGNFEGGSYLFASFTPAAQGTLARLEPLYGRDRDIGRRCQLFLRPTQKRPRSFDLPN